MSLAGFTLPMAAAALRAAIEADRCPTEKGNEGERAADRVPGAVNDRPRSPLHPEPEKPHVAEGQVQAPADHPSRPVGETAEGSRGPATVCNPPHATPAIARATPEIIPIEIKPSPAWQRRRETLRKWGYPANTRGRLADLTPAIAPVAPAIAPLSPKDIDPKILAKVAPAIAPPAIPPPGAHPLPEDWRPSAGRLRTAILKGGEIGAANLVATFCNHFHVRANELRTAAGWQGRFSNWIIREWPDDHYPRLPLMRPVAAGPPPNDKWEALRRDVHSHAARGQSG